MSEAPSSPAAPLTEIAAGPGLRAWQVLAIVIGAQVVGMPAASYTWQALTRPESASGFAGSKPPAASGAGLGRKSVALELAGCEGLDAPSCFWAAKLLSELPEDRSFGDDDTPAIKLLWALRRGCALKSGPACSMLGKRREAGEGVERDHAIAARLYRRACLLKTTSGCGRLGRLHEFGRGVPVDLERASQLYGRACDLGDPLGCRELERLKKRADP